jgi:hypothetical protein
MLHIQSTSNEGRFAGRFVADHRNGDMGEGRLRRDLNKMLGQTIHCTMRSSDTNQRDRDHTSSARVDTPFPPGDVGVSSSSITGRAGFTPPSVAILVESSR